MPSHRLWRLWPPTLDLVIPTLGTGQDTHGKWHCLGDDTWAYNTCARTDLFVVDYFQPYSVSGCSDAAFRCQYCSHLLRTCYNYIRTKYVEAYREKVTDVDRRSDPSTRQCSYIVQWRDRTATSCHSGTTADSRRRSSRSRMLYTQYTTAL